MFSTKVLREALKQTTGIYGLPVHPNPLPTLTSIYERILHSLQRLPENASYRQYSESMIKRQLDLVKSCQTVSEVETRLGRNNIEEVIAEAEKELKLIPLMESWKPWEPLQNNPPPGQWEYKYGNASR